MFVLTAVMFGRAWPPALQRASRTLRERVLQPTPPTMVGLPTVRRCNSRTNAVSTSVRDAPVSITNGTTRPWTTTLTTAAVDPSRACTTVNGMVDDACADVPASATATADRAAAQAAVAIVIRLRIVPLLVA